MTSAQREEQHTQDDGLSLSAQETTQPLLTNYQQQITAKASFPSAEECVQQITEKSNWQLLMLSGEETPLLTDEHQKLHKSFSEVLRLPYKIIIFPAPKVVELF